MTKKAVTKQELINILQETREDIIVLIGDDMPIIQTIDEILHRCTIDEEDENID